MKSRSVGSVNRPLAHDDMTMRLIFAVLLGNSLYRLLEAVMSSIIMPFLYGLSGAQEARRVYGVMFPDPRYLFGLAARPRTIFNIDFNGSLIPYDRVLGTVGVLLLAAVVTVLLVRYARDRWSEVERNEVEKRACPECRCLIPPAARRCAWCRSPVQPEIQA